MSSNKSKLSREEILELSQLADDIITAVENNDSLTMADLYEMYPIGKVKMVLAFAPIFGCEDAINHLFASEKGTTYTASELESIALENEIQRMFAEQMYAEDMFYKEHSEEEYAL
jgi:hypothetical protein